MDKHSIAGVAAGTKRIAGCSPCIAVAALHSCYWVTEHTGHAVGSLAAGTAASGYAWHAIDAIAQIASFWLLHQLPVVPVASVVAVPHYPHLDWSYTHRVSRMSLES